MGARPLGLYIFTNDMAHADRVLMRAVSGGMCVNTALLHGAFASLPFGGSDQWDDRIGGVTRPSPRRAA